MKPVIRVSSVDQLLRCHASRPLSANIADKSGKDANDGSYVHWQTGHELITSHGAVAGSDFRKPDFPEQYVFPIRDSWIIDACVRNGIYSVPDNWSIIVEDEVEWEYPNFILRGHVDFIGLCPEAQSAAVKDWKAGAVYQDPAECNYQIMAYGVLVWRSWQTIDWMSLSLFQPRAFIGDEIERDSIEYIVGREAFEQAEAFLVDRIDDALENWTNLSTGPKQCRWCPAFFGCPGIKAERKRMELQITENDLKDAADRCSNSDLAELLHGVKIFQPRIDDITGEVKDRIRSGETLIADGKVFALQTKPWGHKVVDKAVFVDLLRGAVGQDKIDKVATISMGDAQKLIADEYGIPKASKVEGKDNAASWIQGYSEDNLEPQTREFITFQDVEE